MKNWILVSLFLSANIFTTSAFASAKETLNQRLNEHQSFSAEFTQQVVSPEGDVLMDATGTAKILRPSLFRWETKTPDENLLVSDGQNVWYYDPFMSQVTIMTQENATAQTPFVLLTRNQASDWEQYNVTQNGDTFTLVDTKGGAGSFIISIDEKGVVQGFQVVEQDGQTSKFTFSQVAFFTLGQSQFTFEVPNGVDIDDQR